MQKESAYGSTREEALSNLDSKMIRQHPDAIYSRDCVSVHDYGNEKSEDKFVAEVTF